jgi:hypothetical protein
MASAHVTSRSLDVVDSIDGVEFDTDTDTFWATYDSARDSVSLAVVAIVAAVEDRSPTDLTPLQSAVDTDALQSLFQTPAGQPPTPTSTSFRYEGYEVTVSSEEVVQVTPLEDA